MASIKKFLYLCLYSLSFISVTVIQAAHLPEIYAAALRGDTRWIGKHVHTACLANSEFSGSCLLVYAVRSKNNEMVALLLERGADVNKNKGEAVKEATNLYHVIPPHLPILTLLLSQHYVYGIPLVHAALNAGKDLVTHLLLCYSVLLDDINCNSYDMQLFIARQPAVIQAILRNDEHALGGALMHFNATRESLDQLALALILAIGQRAPSLVKILIEHGVPMKCNYLGTEVNNLIKIVEKDQRTYLCARNQNISKIIRDYKASLLPGDIFRAHRTPDGELEWYS